MSDTPNQDYEVIFSRRQSSEEKVEAQANRQLGDEARQIQELCEIVEELEEPEFIVYATTT